MIVCCCPSSREVFQSSLPRGERRVRVTYCTSCGNISILAPTRGATNSEAGNNRGIRFQSSLPRGERRIFYQIAAGNRKFQSSLPRGERRICKANATVTTKFQSSLPRGERRSYTGGYGGSVTDFNPRSHEGSDSNFRQKVLFSLSKNCLKYLILTTNYFN